VAIEEAVLLGKALDRQYRLQTNTAASTHTGSDNGNDVKEVPWHEVTGPAIAELDSSRASRIRRLRFFADVSQRIGHLDSRFLCSLRDTLFMTAPTALKSAIFDQAIRAVSDDSHVRK
jgi:hypothetical protein